MKTLAEVVSEGDYRASLEALRDTLAGEIECGALCKRCGGVMSSPTAGLAKQLADVLKVLEALPTGKERTIDDELALQRQRRGVSDAQHGAEGPELAGG